MKLILKEDIAPLGRMGDLIDVADGYARNFLLPKRKATIATTKNVKLFEHEKRVIADRVRKDRLSAEGAAEKIGALTVSISAKVGEEGKLFGSVSSKDIAEAMAAQGVEVDRRKILLERPIKELGTYPVKVKVHHDITAEVKVDVVGMDDAAPSSSQDP
ncbi:MAG: 50S ribosomal protein L9 [Nitrospiria bacterium]